MSLPPPSSIAGLVHAASLTNQELFTSVVARIKQSFGRGKGATVNDWRSVAIQVATAAAKGAEGHGCADEWVRQFNELSSDGKDGAGGGQSFGEAMRDLPRRECYRRRLDNAFASLASADAALLSVKQAAGLVRGSALLSSESRNDDDQSAGSDCEHQTRAISQLVRCMPQLASNPCDIFMAVQQPLLQKMNWGAFANGGINFASSDAERGFRYLLDLEDGTADTKVGEKRKRASEEHSTLAYLLEAAHLARKGNVRAQHGAVIYIQSEDGNVIVGRGWNHDRFLSRKKDGKNKIVLHSEVMAVADAIRIHGEDKCFEELFPQSTILIVELESDYTYDTCHPCPKCDPMLRAVGIPKVLHTTPHGKLKELDLGPGKPQLLSLENVSYPLGAACNELEIRCERLERAVSAAKR